MSTWLGMNGYYVWVATWSRMDMTEYRCLWIGRARYQCAKCRLGYVTVVSPTDHDERCPECGARVLVRPVE